MRKRLFGRFEQSSESARRFGGSGLGLPIVHRAVEAHHGFVFVDAAPGGARFTVLLPVRQEDGDGGLRLVDHAPPVDQAGLRGQSGRPTPKAIPA